jgi:uncharacterized membrane protein
MDINKTVERIKAGLDVLKHGYEVSDVEKWKSGNMFVGTLVSLLSALILLINQFDCKFCNIQLDSNTLLQISTGILGLYALIRNVISASTSKRVSINPIENIKVMTGTSTATKYVTQPKWDGRTERRTNDDPDDDLESVSDELAEKIRRNQ